jgi:hypothetical protein
VGTDFLIPSPKETFVFVRGQVLRGMCVRCLACE